MGYYYAEHDIFKEITKSTGAVGCRHPLAFILEAADDIAYKTADIEDAAKKGFITYQQLLDELKSERYCGKCADDGERAEYDKAVGKLESYLTYAKTAAYPPQKRTPFRGGSSTFRACFSGVRLSALPAAMT